MTLVILVTALAFVSACSSSQKATSVNSSTSPSAPSTSSTAAVTALTFTVTMTGVASASGSFSVEEPTFKSCATVGTTASQPNSFEFAIPGSEGEEVSGLGFGLQVGIADYSGPGTYTVPNNGSLEAVYLGSHQFSLVFATVTVNADGSGVITFSHETDLLGYFDSGTISWTCT